MSRYFQWLQIVCYPKYFKLFERGLLTTKINIKMKTTTHYKGHRWTNEELKQLMQMWAADIPIETIASELKSTHTSILKQVQRLRTNGIPLKRRDKGHRNGIKNTLWTQGEIEYLLRKRNEKATSEEIGIQLGRSANAVDAMIAKLRKEEVDIKMRGNGVRKLWDAEALKAVSLQPQFV